MKITNNQVHEFLNRLHGEEGCNFRKDKKGEDTWTCKAAGPNYGEHNLARKILTKMGISKTEQKRFIDECKEYGGYCDCEILFNSAETLVKKYKFIKKIKR